MCSCFVLEHLFPFVCVGDGCDDGVETSIRESWLPTILNATRRGDLPVLRLLTTRLKLDLTGTRMLDTRLIINEAARYGRKTVVKWLLKEGVGVEGVRDWSGIARNGDLEMLELLVGNGKKEGWERGVVDGIAALGDVGMAKVLF